MPAVSTAEEDYRGYRLQAVRVFSDWQVAIYPNREGLPFALPDDLPSAPSLDEALDKARWRVDHMLEDARRR
jgi:hypothetical protein